MNIIHHPIKNKTIEIQIINNNFLVSINSLDLWLELDCKIKQEIRNLYLTNEQ